MKFMPSVIAAALTLLSATVVAPSFAGAQGYPGESRNNGYNNGNQQGNYGNAPLMQARSWHEVERAGDTWDGFWTFDDRSHRTISATWVDRQTGARVSSPRMTVRQRGNQISISRPGTGEYTGTLSADGTTLRGTMSWIQGSFTARVPQQ